MPKPVSVAVVGGAKGQGEAGAAKAGARGGDRRGGQHSRSGRLSHIRITMHVWVAHDKVW